MVSAVYTLLDFNHLYSEINQWMQVDDMLLMSLW